MSKRRTRTGPMGVPGGHCARCHSGRCQCRTPHHLPRPCRQRQFIILGNRVPTAAPDTWVAPNAVVVGDVDLYERVGPALCRRVPGTLLPLHSQLWHAAWRQVRSCMPLMLRCKDLGRAGRPGTHPGMPLRCAMLAHSPCYAAELALLPTICPISSVQTSIWYGCVLRGDLNRVKVSS